MIAMTSKGSRPRPTHFYPRIPHPLCSSSHLCSRPHYGLLAQIHPDLTKSSASTCTAHMDPLLHQILRSTNLLPHCADLSTYLRITDKAGEKWVTLFGHFRDIPEGAAKAQRETNSMSRNRDINRLQHAYWKYPKWFDGRRPWTAYVPDAACRHSRAESSTSYWMFANYVTTHKHLDTVCLDRVSTELCDIILQDFTTLKGILNELQVYTAAGKPALPSDIPLVARVLDTYRGENESLITVLLCCEALIERLRAVSYGLHKVPNCIQSDIVSRHSLQLTVEVLRKF